jgi:hypothetical protein
MIAKDVILQLENKKYIAASGTYFRPSYNEYTNKGKDLQSILNKPSTTCNVCALGGVFASCVRITDDVKIDAVGTYSNDRTMRFKLQQEGIFSEKQLACIEAAFEEWDNNLRYKFRYTLMYRTRKGLKNTYGIDKDKEAMISIMKNIISNKGSFRPDR